MTAPPARSPGPLVVVRSVSHNYFPSLSCSRSDRSPKGFTPHYVLNSVHVVTLLRAHGPKNASLVYYHSVDDPVHPTRLSNPARTEVVVLGAWCYYIRNQSVTVSNLFHYDSSVGHKPSFTASD